MAPMRRRDTRPRCWGRGAGNPSSVRARGEAAAAALLLGGRAPPQPSGAARLDARGQCQACRLPRRAVRLARFHPRSLPAPVQKPCLTAATTITVRLPPRRRAASGIRIALWRQALQRCCCAANVTGPCFSCLLQGTMSTSSRPMPAVRRLLCCGLLRQPACLPPHDRAVPWPCAPT